MDYCLSYTTNPTSLYSFPSSKVPTFARRRSVNFNDRRPLVVIAAGSDHHRTGSFGRTEYSGLHAPLELTTEAGKFLSGVFLNDFERLQVSAEKLLEKLASDRDQALARVTLSIGSDEAFLHRRIAELKELECQTAVEEVMYMLILSKFSEIRVHLVPRLSRCICNGRLEVFPMKDWQLESIHSFEVLEMIREHLTTMVGWRANSNVTDAWATTQIRRLHLCQMYAASMLYGYFLKSALTRHHLEQSLSQIHSDLSIRSGSHLPLSEVVHLEAMNMAFGCTSSLQSASLAGVSRGQSKNQGKLKGFLMRFDTETVRNCAQPWSKEALNLIQRHNTALFVDEGRSLLEADEVIYTSFATLKRFVLEAVAMGSFLWDTEEYVNTVYRLGEKK